jgi:CheY-like chemotaxis protein
MVDDEKELLFAVVGMLKNEFGEGRVKGTSDPTEAMRWLTNERPSVLITDVRMPEISGLELIQRVQETWGAIPTIVITAFPSDSVVGQVKRGGFTFLPKPFSIRSLLEAVRQLELVTPPSFSGSIAVSTLADLLQLYAISNNTGMLSVRSGTRLGEVWFERGQITHAVAGDKQGFEAFSEVVTWPRGSFGWKTRRTDLRTIHISVSELLLEAFRLLDEASQEHGAPPDEVLLPEPVALPGPAARGPSESPPPTLSSSPGSALLAQDFPGDDGFPDITSPTKKEQFMSNITESLTKLNAIDGFIGAALVDSDSGMTLGIQGGGGILNLEVAAAGNTEVVRAKRKTMKNLNLRDDIEDILITLRTQYHLIRPLKSRPGVFFYLALDRTRANLAMARFSLADVEKELAL